MKKFSSKALLGALSKVGTIAAFGIIAGTAHATPVVSVSTVNIPLELVSNGGILVITSDRSNPLVYTPTATVTGAAVALIVNITGGSQFDGPYYLLGPGGYDSCSSILSPTDTPSLTIGSEFGSPCSLTAGVSYTLSYFFTPHTVVLTTSSTIPIVVSMSSPAGVGSATLFTPTPELSFSLSSFSTYNIDTSQTTFTNGPSYDPSSAANSISMTDNYNTASWLTNSYINSGTINFVFSNIPSSVMTVAGNTDITTSNTHTISAVFGTTTPYNGSATLTYTFGIFPVLSNNPGSATYSFSFFNSGPIASGTIDVAVNGADLTNLSGSNYSLYAGNSYTWLSATPFISFSNSNINIYGELVYLDSSLMPSTYNEELRLALPSTINPSIVPIFVAGSSCGTLDQYVLSSVSEGNQTTYNLNVSGLLAASCISGNSYNNGDLVPVQISLPATANISQVSGVAFAWGNGIYKRLPLNVVQGSPTQLTY